VLGTDELYAYLDKYGLALDAQFQQMIGTATRKPWKRFVTADNRHLANNDALDLLDKVLRYDHESRLTAKEAMEHPYFSVLAK
jgi:casein kinase II subunit alpha